MLDNLFIMGSLGVVVFLMIVLFVQRMYQHPSLQKPQNILKEDAVGDTLNLNQEEQEEKESSDHRPSDRSL